MKRGKDEEKTMGPMFPRLHVNDTEKGGPRAPPRNKMALYEQLSIPSQRFNPAVMPFNHPNNPNNLVPPASSSQGNGNERGNFYPPQLPPAEKAHTRYADINTPLVQQEQKKKPNEDDFSVPVFVQPAMDQENNNNNNNNYNNRSNNTSDRQRLSPYSPAYSVLNQQRGNNREEPKQTETTGSQLRKQSNPPSRYATNSFSRSHNAGDNLQHGHGVESQAGNSIQGGTGGGVANEPPIRGVDYRNSSVPVRDVQQEDQRSPTDMYGDDVSETSMLDSISGIDISPDDVVGIIGQKHFWKARRAIVNQQRVFAVQVFELHRLMKVQRLIAGAPHLLIEDVAYLGKPLKAAPAKKLPLEYIVKVPPKIAEQKVVSEKPNHTTECSAENAVGKASHSSVQNGSQPSNYPPFSSNPPPYSGNPPPTPSSNDSSKMGSWGFNQPPGHQWLIPVMSPSEGLVYKPYPGPGFMSPVCGGYGPPPGAQPVMGNFMNYGVPPPPHHHYQGLGLTPFTPPPGHGYFPPFGMPVMNPAVSGSVSEQGPNNQLSGGGSTFNVPYQGSCNVPSQKNRNGLNPVKPHPSKDSELQFSTASSPSERQGGAAAAAVHVGGGAATDGRNALPLFPTSPAAQVPDCGGAQPQEANQVARVIKVVPHNARSATESVARIFQSIQDERKQYE